MSEATIKAFFNPRAEGDTFNGLNSSIDGTVAPHVMRNLPDFLKAAGRDYWIRKVPAPHPIRRDEDIEGQYHLIRSSDARVVSPHTVTGEYAPLSLVDVAEELMPWVAEGWATPDGVYDRNGSLEVLSLRLDAGQDDPTFKEFRHYAIIQNPHATGGKAKGKIISFRVVCANTFAACVAAASDFTISHRVANGESEMQASIMRDRAKLAVQTWENLKKHVRQLADRTETLKSAPLTVAAAESLTDRLLGIEGKDPEKVSAQKTNQRDAIQAAFAMPKFGTFGQTAYDWLNAVTFVQSSPFSSTVQKSKVGAAERFLRNVDTNGVGYALEASANKLLEEAIA